MAHHVQLSVWTKFHPPRYIRTIGWNVIINFRVIMFTQNYEIHQCINFSRVKETLQRILIQLGCCSLQLLLCSRDFNNLATGNSDTMIIAVNSTSLQDGFLNYSFAFTKLKLADCSFMLNQQCDSGLTTRLKKNFIYLFFLHFVIEA